MPENLQPEDMSSWMRSIEKRLAAVERPTRLSTVQYTAVSEPNQSVQVTSGTFTTVWEFGLSQVVADSVNVGLVMTADAGTTGQVRVVNLQLPGQPATDAFTIGPGQQRLVIFNWLVPGLVLNQRAILIQVQVRRTGGSGNVNAFQPIVAMQLPSYVYNATADGNIQFTGD